MLRAVANVCAAILVIAFFSVQCYSLEIHFEKDDNNVFQNIEDDIDFENINDVRQLNEQSRTELPKESGDKLLSLLFGGNLYQKVNSIENNDVEDVEVTRNDEPDRKERAVKSRVVRQTYSGQSTLYPKLPSNSPYNQQYPNNNNQYQQWHPQNNYSQSGYPANGASNFRPQQNVSYGHNPYNPSQPEWRLPTTNNGHNPYYNSTSSSFPGFQPGNSTAYNPGYNRPAYGQPGNWKYNNTNTFPATHQQPYPGYPTNSYNPNPYSTTPANRHPVIYSNVTHRPGQNPPYNPSYWDGKTLNHTNSANSRPYNSSNAQNPQYFNSPYGQPNSNNPYNVPNQAQAPYPTPSNSQYPGPINRPGQYPAFNNNNAYRPGHNMSTTNTPGSQPYGQNPYQPYNGQPSNGYLSNAHGADNFNLANGYNPSIPNKPPYGSGPGQNQYRYPPDSSGIAHDPTKVSPEYFSYPH